MMFVYIIFIMTFCSFGGDSDLCGAVDWAPQDKLMIPVLPCKIDMTQWLKNKFNKSGASGSRGRPGEPNNTKGMF